MSAIADPSSSLAAQDVAANLQRRRRATRVARAGWTRKIS
jgi:hypothetical protein